MSGVTRNSSETFEYGPDWPEFVDKCWPQPTHNTGYCKTCDLPVVYTEMYLIASCECPICGTVVKFEAI